MFEFEYITINNLPRLSWLADADKKSGKVKVFCGKAVECFPEFFVAGVWDGEFLKADFDTSDAFYGTGAKIFGETLDFVTPSHALARIQSFEEEHRLCVSNSLPFLASYCALSLDPGQDQYESYFCSILDGLKKYKEYVPLKEKKQIRQVFVGKLVLYGNGKTEVVHRQPIERFTSFDDYYSRLFASFEAVRDNAMSPSRKEHYGMVTTISSGYDSTCSAVIAKKLGCDSAFSISGGQYDIDSGVDIASNLGYSRITKRNKSIYRDKIGLIDAEYVSSGEFGTLQFSIFEEDFSENLVFLGSRGSYWEKDLNMTEDFEMDNYFYYETEISWTENALKNGYITLPLPAFGASVCESIKDVTNSEEMEPWTLHNSYDKPIPRRIVETAGISRKAFGQKKYGGGFYMGYDTLKSLKRKMSKEGYAAFLEYHKLFRHTKPLRRLYHGFRYHLAVMPILLKKLGLKWKIHCKALRISNPYAPSELFFWSMDVMKNRYKEAMKRL